MALYPVRENMAIFFAKFFWIRNRITMHCSSFYQVIWDTVQLGSLFYSSEILFQCDAIKIHASTTFKEKLIFFYISTIDMQSLCVILRFTFYNIIYESRPQSIRFQNISATEKLHPLYLVFLSFLLFFLRIMKCVPLFIKRTVFIESNQWHA